ncbi:hypothetical protein SEPCBS57363_003875 [Sporothrix epigloea]|uniref:RING-type E3 ubiquitin transferase n=1 Tax=Sporothrix epigloea TaxID=1892477 RepID=A0ABP0DP19_9PEZI
MHVEAEAAGELLCVTPDFRQQISHAVTTNTTLVSTTASIAPARKAPSPAASSVTSSSSTDRCVICLDTVAEPCVAQPCGHRHYDFLCLLSWLLSRHPSCPLCKATVETVQFGDNLAKTFSVPNKTEDEAATVVEPVLASTTSGARVARSRRERRSYVAPFPPLSQEPPAVALERRRRVYRLGVFARHVGANRHSRCYRELTPQLFAQDPDLVSRARAFLRRELQVFWEGENRPVTDAAILEAARGGRRANNAEFLLEYIVAILQTIDLQDSAGQAEELLQGFFRGRRDHTRQFLHELRSFLRSPYLTLASWDRHVQYGLPGQLAGLEESDDHETGPEQTEAHRSADNKRRMVMRGDYYRPRHNYSSRSKTCRNGRTGRDSRAHRVELNCQYDPS